MPQPHYNPTCVPKDEHDKEVPREYYLGLVARHNATIGAALAVWERTIEVAVALRHTKPAEFSLVDPWSFLR